MILIEQAPGGYALRRSDAPLSSVIIVAADELADAVAALFDDTVDNYTDTWDAMCAATETAQGAGTLAL